MDHPADATPTAPNTPRAEPICRVLRVKFQRTARLRRPVDTHLTVVQVSGSPLDGGALE
jgi:hypothetical protein